MWFLLLNLIFYWLKKLSKNPVMVYEKSIFFKIIFKERRVHCTYASPFHLIEGVMNNFLLTLILSFYTYSREKKDKELLCGQNRKLLFWLFSVKIYILNSGYINHYLIKQPETITASLLQNDWGPFLNNILTSFDLVFQYRKKHRKIRGIQCFSGSLNWFIRCVEKVSIIELSYRIVSLLFLAFPWFALLS